MRTLTLTLLLLWSAFATACDCHRNVQQLVDSNDFNKAFTLLSKCGDLNDPEILFSLAMLHVNNTVTKSSLDAKLNRKSVEYLLKAIKMGHVNARSLLSEILLNENYKGISKNVEVANCLKYKEKRNNYYVNCIKSL